MHQTRWSLGSDNNNLNGPFCWKRKEGKTEAANVSFYDCQKEEKYEVNGQKRKEKTKVKGIDATEGKTSQTKHTQKTFVPVGASQRTFCFKWKKLRSTEEESERKKRNKKNEPENFFYNYNKVARQRSLSTTLLSFLSSSNQQRQQKVCK